MAAADTKEKRARLSRMVIIACALTFLYLPILTLVVYSFNESRMVTVWTETSFKWYYALFNDAAIIHAVGISLLIAAMTAVASVVIGTLAAFVLVRVHRFRGESLFVLLMTAPMVLPEVVTGLALLLIFVTLGSGIDLFAERGITAIWIAHVTFCSAYATVVIRGRFRELDITIEEAAMDLGAGPVKVFFAVILPALMPSEIAALLLSFTMSMDDLVITSFIAGPDSTTLPMLIFSSVRRGLSPEINALATIIVLIVSICTFFAWLSMVKKQKRLKADAAKAAKAAKAEETLRYRHKEQNTNVLLPAELALLKEQAKALAQGKDTAEETTHKLLSVADASVAAAERDASIMEALQHSEQEAPAQSSESSENAAVDSLKTTTSSLNAAHTKTLHSHDQLSMMEQAVVKGVAHPQSLDSSSSDLSLAHQKAQLKAQGHLSLGDSARDATSHQREVNSSLAAEGHAKVLDQSTLASLNLLNATSHSGTAAHLSTTADSLEDARARMKHGMTYTSAEPTRTTLNSLQVAKARAEARAVRTEKGTSAIAVTRDSTEQAKSTVEQAKVVDTTEK